MSDRDTEDEEYVLTATGRLLHALSINDFDEYTEVITDAGQTGGLSLLMIRWSVMIATVQDGQALIDTIHADDAPPAADAVWVPHLHVLIEAAHQPLTKRSAAILEALQAALTLADTELWHLVWHLAVGIWQIAVAVGGLTAWQAMGNLHAESALTPQQGELAGSAAAVVAAIANSHREEGQAYLEHAIERYDPTVSLLPQLWLVMTATLLRGNGKTALLLDPAGLPDAVLHFDDDQPTDGDAARTAQLIGQVMSAGTDNDVPRLLRVGKDLSTLDLEHRLTLTIQLAYALAHGGPGRYAQTLTTSP